MKYSRVILLTEAKAFHVTFFKGNRQNEEEVDRTRLKKGKRRFLFLDKRGERFKKSFNF